MKNFFQRKQDAQPNPRSNTPANEAYRIWLPPPNTSRAPAPVSTAWVPATPQTGARRGGETQRSSSRAPRADASSMPTSSTYKYATVPPNSTGFYYSNPAQPVPAQPFPQQYYTSLPRPPPDRPDSRLGHAPGPYAYPNPQYPQTFAAPPPSQPAVSKRREDKTRNTVDGRGPSTVPVAEPPTGQPASSRGHGTDRAPRKPSSSSLREDAEVKKSKHRPKEPSETRKRRDSQVVDPYAEKRRDKSSRKESRRDVRSRPDSRAEEGDSSDSSIQRPSSAGHRRRSDEGKPSVMMSSRTGLPMQPTAASSSSGKHTPQIPRMPVYLPANHGRSQRPDDGQPGLSESDTDHGTFNRGRNFLRATAPQNSKQTIPNVLGGPSALTAINKKVKESKGLWPFSRSKSSQKIPQSMPMARPSTADNPAKKTRADSTPSRFVSMDAST
ncbi:hypothetical protein B0H19DRAFT_1165968 [Mycena capillaripes]|nr:hypothetical protein B0H19DRAFT_1165968 [Mycena capillaripes]